MNNEWYKNLRKPAWTPAPNIIGLIWTILYPIIFLCFIYDLFLFFTQQFTFIMIFPFILNLFFNVIFTPIQFTLKNLYLASLDILAVLLTIFWIMTTNIEKAPIIVFALIPYLIWVTIASILQFNILFLNMKKKL